MIMKNSKEKILVYRRDPEDLDCYLYTKTDYFRELILRLKYEEEHINFIKNNIKIDNSELSLLAV